MFLLMDRGKLSWLEQGQVAKDLYGWLQNEYRMHGVCDGAGSIVRHPHSCLDVMRSIHIPNHLKLEQQHDVVQKDSMG